MNRIRKLLNTSRYLGVYDSVSLLNNPSRKSIRTFFQREQLKLFSTDISREENIVKSTYSDFIIPNALLHEYIWQYVDRFPDLIAMECGITGKKYTFSQLRERSAKFAAALLKSGFRPGHVIAVLLPNLPEYPIVVLGSQEAGLVTTTLNPTYTTDEIYYQLKTSGANCVVTIPDRINVVRDVSAKLEKESEGKIKIKIISIQDYDGVSRPSLDNVWSFKEMVENNLDMADYRNIIEGYDITQDSLTILPYSSGTTGLPKGVCLTHQNLVSAVAQEEAVEVKMIIQPCGNTQDVIPAILPYYHIFGMKMILFVGIRNGAKQVTIPKFDPNDFVNVLKNHETTNLHLVPPLLLFIGQYAGVKKEYLKSNRTIACGGAPSSLFDINKCMGKANESTVFIQGYGLTETTGASIIPYSNRKVENYETCGRPISMTQVKIINEDGKALRANENGEICIRGPQIMKGYLNNPEATAETADKDGWLHTGDIGYYDNSNLFYIIDRKKEMIKVKGLQVAPAELESILKTHPIIADVGVIGVPDVHAGEVPVAFVVLKDDKKHLSDDKASLEIKSFMAEKVSNFKQLKQVIVSKEIPRRPSGKILKRDLKTEYEKISL